MNQISNDAAPKQIAAITTVRNDAFFLEKWIQYYGAQLGLKNLYVFLDGHDQILPEAARDINTLFLPRQPLERVPAMRRRARVMSDLARGLFRYFDAVIVTDVDEFVIVDPALNLSLVDYLSSPHSTSTLSGLGLDVGQHMELETPLDQTKPFLDQRGFAHLSSRYTKPNIAFRPVTWGSGMHRIKGRNFRIDPNLFLFHFGMVDYQLATGKTADADRLATGWTGHLSRREQLFKIIAESKPIDGDDYFEQARKYQTRHRPFYALNKPAMIPGNPVVRIPERFRGII
ncbi:MAG: glycosyltransferase family 2 protein [Rhodobacteraceae bacterium]|nr:glycosyltransferase family 2 protein [Paracoccaceae bacterium]